MRQNGQIVGKIVKKLVKELIKSTDLLVDKPFYTLEKYAP